MSYGQGSKSADSSKSQAEINKACLKLIAEAEAKDKEIIALRADKADFEIIRKALQDKAALLEEIVKIKDADIKRLQQAGSLDSQAIGELKAQREQYRTELEKVRKERDKARSIIRKVGGIAAFVGAVVGGTIVYLIRKD